MYLFRNWALENDKVNTLGSFHVKRTEWRTCSHLTSQIPLLQSCLCLSNQPSASVQPHTAQPAHPSFTVYKNNKMRRSTSHLFSMVRWTSLLCQVQLVLCMHRNVGSGKFYFLQKTVTLLFIALDWTWSKIPTLLRSLVGYLKTKKKHVERLQYWKLNAINRKVSVTHLFATEPVVRGPSQHTWNWTRID